MIVDMLKVLAKHGVLEDAVFTGSTHLTGVGDDLDVVIKVSSFHIVDAIMQSNGWEHTSSNEKYSSYRKGGANITCNRDSLNAWKMYNSLIKHLEGSVEINKNARIILAEISQVPQRVNKLK